MLLAQLERHVCGTSIHTYLKDFTVEFVPAKELVPSQPIVRVMLCMLRQQDY